MYPFTWEVPLENVYLDGVKLPLSTLSSPFISLSGLIDNVSPLPSPPHSTHPFSFSLSCLQGDSILHGPAHVVCNIQSKLGPNRLFPCSEPHTITFSIGGKLFPVDPLDFIQQVSENNVVTCTSRLGSMNPPVLTGYQSSWILGDLFLKRCVLYCLFSCFRPWRLCVLCFFLAWCLFVR